MKAETKLKLDKWKPRPYQIPILDAIENRGIKRVVAIWPRRSGKDVCLFNLCIRQALRKTQNIFYFLPTHTQGKAVIWNSITNEGQRMLDFIPKELIDSLNSQEMRIRFINGSQIFILGSDNYDRIVGSNCHGMVFSEYALADPRCYTYLRPILVANDGWCAFVSTPRGKNHLHQMYEIARNSPDWFASKLTVEDTGHISLHEIEKERHEGLISEDMIQQEYFCFPAGQHVLTAAGSTPIEEIDVNDMVISHSGRTRKVMDTIARDYEGQLIVINSYGSSDEIMCTPNHPIRIYNPSTQSYSWKEAQHLTLEDRLVFPKMSMGNYPIINHDLCMLLAWYITEGSCFNNGVQFTVKKEESYRIGKYLTNLSIPWDSYDNESITNVVVNSVQLVDFFKSSCGLQANNKRIPFNLISTFEDEFFHELIRGDGCYNLSNNYEKYVYSTVSKTLAYQIQLLANSLNLGYAAGISKRDAYEGCIQGRQVSCQESYQVNISFPGLKNKISWLTRAKNCIAARIKSIDSRHFQGIVYNLKVQYDESYLVFGRAVHNCSFELGVEGSFYQKYVDKMRLDGRITDVPYEINFPVFSAWDIGVRDSTSIIFWQNIGSTVRIIDYYENQKEGLEHYINVLKEKGYHYAKHYAPHDIAVKEFGTGLTRYEKAAQLGFKFEMKSDRYGKKISAVPNVSIMDGIEAVRSSFSKIWIDQTKCEQLIKCLENYRQEYDHKLKVYKSIPLHNFASHGADAMRYLCLSLPRTRDSKSGEELEQAFQKHKYGDNYNMPSVFRTDLPNY